MVNFSRMIRGLVVLVVVCAGATLAQTKPEKIDALMRKYLDYGQFNGSVLVAEKGTVILKKGYGLANMEWDIPNAPDTKFRLGSITKQFTSMLVMQQVEKGLIGLDDPIVKYLKDYPKPQGERITVRHLLTHTSGTPNYTEFLDIRRDRKPYTVEQLIATFSAKALEFEPGSKWHYSNSGYVLLGAILEKATGKTYEHLLRESILDPLGMTNTGYDHYEPILKKRAAGYERAVNMENAAFLDMSVPFAAGAMYSTVEDLYLWDRALYTDKLIAAKTKAVYFKPFLNHYAFGWGVNFTRIGESSDSVLAISHGGGINGFNTLILRIPDAQHLIVLLNNTGGTSLEEMARGICGILYDKDYAQPRRSLASELGKFINEKGLEQASQTFKELKERTKEYSLRESEMNMLGYQLLQQGKAKAAIEVFKLNVDTYPKSWNVYDSLGEAYMTDGQTAQAIMNYEKSIELNPGNVNGAEILKKLKGEK